MSVQQLQSTIRDQRKVITDHEQSNDAKEKTIEDLRAELRKARQLLAQSSLSAHVTTSSISLFMKILPPEVRIRIYRYLLVNPQLGEVWWIGSNTKHGASFKYNLSPSVLRVCRTIYDEALPILYSSNTFILVCHRKVFNVTYYLPQCPLTRYIEDRPYCREVRFVFDEIPTLKYIKRWFIVTTDPQQAGLMVSKGFTDFCHAVCHFPLGYLKVTLILTQDEVYANGGNAATNTFVKRTTSQVQNIAPTLEVFRNIDSVEVRTAKESDIPYGLFTENSKRWCVDSANHSAAIQAGCQKSLRNQDSSRLERVFEMQALLLAYAQAFERDAQFKAEMDPKYVAPVPNFEKSTDLLLTENPFLCFHAVEIGLREAEAHSGKQNIAKFKTTREKVLSALNAQYQEITSAIQKVQRCVQEQKQPCALLDPEIAHDPEIYEIAAEKALKVLESAAESFKRDLNIEISLQIRKRPGIYRVRYEHLLREKLLSQMNLAIQKGLEDDSGQFVEWFKLCVDDFQEQFIEIFSARKKLFEADVLSQPPSSYDYDTRYYNASDETIDWSVDESIFED